MQVNQADVIWTPSHSQIAESGITHYTNWLKQRYGHQYENYDDLWQWSTDKIEDFWCSIWDYFEIQADGDRGVALASSKMPGAQWFPNTQLNYTEHIFRNTNANAPALITRSESSAPQLISWNELQRDVAALAFTMRELGIQQGDRVVAYLPNIAQAVIGFLASASIGAIWSSCSPEMGLSVVLDRFQQIEPKILLATDSYSYGGKIFDRHGIVAEMLTLLPSIENVIHVAGPAHKDTAVPPWGKTTRWESAIETDAPLQSTRVPFSHPLWIVYSSGTTGLPKAMVHSHGGILLTHLKTNRLQHDVRSGDRFMFLGSTGWIVWNLMVGGLLAGATVVLSDGNPNSPNDMHLWDFLDQYQVTHFGCGAAFLSKCMKDGLQPGKTRKFSQLRAINSTGSPLPLDTYGWVYENVKADVWLASISGGTDIASGFVSCAPTLPVTAGEIQCRELGVAAYAFNEKGQAVIDEVGELVITKPMPSMPIFFWNDADGSRYFSSYFDTYSGYWRHGDWIRFTPKGTSVIYGRSDTTINRFGIRMGTAEIYRVVEELEEIKDSLVVDLEYLGRPSYMPLFVTLKPGHQLTPALQKLICDAIRTKASARHVPNEVVEVPAIPRTLTGKKMELPVRKILLGAEASQVANPETMENPEAIDFFIAFRSLVPST